jgi:hypothetical protein
MIVVCMTGRFHSQIYLSAFIIIVLLCISQPGSVDSLWHGKQTHCNSIPYYITSFIKFVHEVCVIIEDEVLMMAVIIIQLWDN